MFLPFAFRFPLSNCPLQDFYMNELCLFSATFRSSGSLNKQVSHAGATQLPLCFDLLMPIPHLLALTPRWILNEICMADAWQQDVKEEAGGGPVWVKRRGLHCREPWSHLKGRLGRTCPRKSGGQTRLSWDRSRRDKQKWFSLGYRFWNKQNISSWVFWHV